ERHVAEALCGGAASLLVFGGLDAVVLDATGVDASHAARLDEPRERTRHAQHAGDALQEDAVEQAPDIVPAERSNELVAVGGLLVVEVDGGLELLLEELRLLDVGRVQAVCFLERG